MFVLKLVKGIVLFVGGMFTFLMGAAAFIGIGTVKKYVDDHPDENEIEAGVNVTKEAFHNFGI